jgi:hypothetical protein
MKKTIFSKGLILLLMAVALLMSACSDFLNQESDTIFSDSEVFSDATMTKSVLADFYNQIDYGPNFENFGDFATTEGTWGELDEASCFQVKSSSTYSTDLWRLYPYTFIRNLNMFLKSLKATDVLTDAQKGEYEAETRFLRAWAYFYMARGLGGMPIVGDRIFSTTDKLADMQLARSTEAEIYDYVISECDSCATKLQENGGTHQAHASKWAALTLKARAAITAASIAKYNNLITPNIKTSNNEVGIPAEKATYYYQLAAKTAKEIIDSKRFSLYQKYSNKATNFYNLFVDKDDNSEVIWARDYKYPDAVHSWSANSCAPSLTGNTASNEVTPLLNLVESYEYINNRDGHLKLTDAKGNYIFYDNPQDLFVGKDPRLKGTIICSGDTINGATVIYQAGQMKLRRVGAKWSWTTKTADAGTKDDDGDIITSINGPRTTSGAWDNTTGFNFRKYLDPSSDGLKAAHGSDVWFIRMRYAEVLFIYAEAELELGNMSVGLPYINAIRERAGISDLSSYTLDDIMQEKRVEFPLENQRYWDLKRWRKAHTEWDGVSENSTQYSLFPYKVKDPRSTENGKWVFVKEKNIKMQNVRSFDLRNYYNFLDEGWLGNNPKLVKNPYQ